MFKDFRDKLPSVLTAGTGKIDLHHKPDIITL